MTTVTTPGRTTNSPPTWIADLPYGSRETINAIARLLGHASDDHDSPATWAARVLDVDRDQLATAHSRPTRTHVRVAGLMLSKAMDAYAEQITISGPGGGHPPMWTPFHIGDAESPSIPARMVVYFPAGTLAAADSCISIFDDSFKQHVRVFTTRADRNIGARTLRELLDVAAGADNPLRGRVLQAKPSSDTVVLSPMRTPEDRREQLVLPDEIWHEVDLCVASITGQRNTLDQLGLGTTRGLLLVGQPGVGKTNLTRVLAAELAGHVTVIFADAATLAAEVSDLYDELDHLGPAMIVFEDIDLIVGRREQPGPAATALADFLTAIDGAKRRHDVLTVATTNNPHGIDRAAQRSARFDTVLTLPPPDEAGRARILRRYLKPIGVELDVAPTAYALDEATGADLREVVRRAVLEHGVAFTANELYDVATSGRWKTQINTGQYL